MNGITLAIFLAAPWLIYLPLELVILWKRRKDKSVKTISMVARDYGYHISCVVYLWGGMASHWWWNAKHFAPWYLGLSFWVIALVRLAQDIIFWKTDVKIWPVPLRVLSHPLGNLLVGFLAGRFLFPQV